MTILTIFSLSIVYYRNIIYIFILINQKNKYFFWKQKKKYFFLKNLYMLTVIRIVTFSKFIYDDYLIPLFCFLVCISILFNSYFHLIIFTFYIIHNYIIGLTYFDAFRKVREEDISTYEYHWSTDTDLILFNKILTVLKYFGILILFFPTSLNFP